MVNAQELSLVVSVYNEGDTLGIFWEETEKCLNLLGISYEVVFVNDGSTDNSLDILANLSQKNDKVKVVNLSRNYGHEAAMLAGIDYSRGDAVVCLDADLQHPPSKLNEMIEKFNEGFEIINMTRRDNEDAGLFKKITSFIFYYILNLLSTAKFEPNASDFFLISRRVADIISNDFSERTRFLRGFIQIIGFRKTTIDFSASKRIAGSSKYSFSKLIILSLSAIVTFSNLPLRLSMMSGVIIAAVSLLVGIISIIVKLFGYVIPGYTTIVVLITFLFAFQLIILGIIGEYLGYIFNETKKRPIYLVENVINIIEKKNNEAEI